MLEASGLRLHEELLLLCLHEEKGTMRVSNWRLAVGGGLLAELLVEGRVRLERGSRASRDRVRMADPRLLADPLLDDCLRRVRDAKKPRAPKDWVMKFSQLSSLRRRVATGLVRRGLLRERRGRVLLLFPWTFYPELDPAPKRRIADRVREAVEGEGELDERTAALVAIAARTGALKPLLGRAVLKERKARIEEIGESVSVASAVRDAVKAARAAAVAAGT
ncbi:MAG: GPP34 family phosphoprotein [Gemmatimonadota bacterium]|nr:GPP34 family phosphoprotein [Gemmatimonadota bacterium]